MSDSSSNVPMVIDGLMINGWGPEAFSAMRAGGVTAVNATCSVWEDFSGTMRNVADWKKWFRDHDDEIIQVFNANDIQAAHSENKVGVILGWQNSSGFGDYIPNVAVYHELGLRIVQLTYNTANSVGCGCYESSDGGLTDFGRELVDELNRFRMLIDLSHVGANTSADAIRASKQPVAYTHVAPRAFFKHPRNKTDEQLRDIAEHDGFVGVTMFPAFMPKGKDSTLEEYLESVEYVIDLVGEDRVGIGSDFCEGRSEEQRYFTAHDKGHARKLVNYGEIRMPDDLRVSDFSSLIQKMEQRGWSDSRIESVVGLNWFNFLNGIWSS